MLSPKLHSLTPVTGPKDHKVIGVSLREIPSQIIIYRLNNIKETRGEKVSYQKFLSYKEVGIKYLLKKNKKWNDTKNQKRRATKF